MKRLLSTVLVVPLLAFAMPQAPGYVMELHNKNVQTQEEWSTFTYVQGQDLLMEMTDGDQAGSMVYLHEAGELIVNNDRDRSYIRMDRETIQQMAEQMGAMMQQLETMLENLPEAQREMIRNSGMSIPGMPDMGERPVIEVRETGQTATHAGYPTTRFDMYVSDRKTQEMWVADWADVDGARDVQTAFMGFADLMSSFLEAMPTGMFGSSNDFSSLMDLQRGVPVVTYELDEDGNRKVETTLRSIEEADVDRSRFGPKDGYREQKIEMPDIG